MMSERELLEKILESQISMQSQINNNHKEVMIKLSSLEKNQEAFKSFILNSDDTFRKSEEAYNTIQKFKEVFSK